MKRELRITVTDIFLSKMATAKIVLFSFFGLFSVALADSSIGDDYVIDSESGESEVPRPLEVWEDKSWHGFPHLKQVTGLGVDVQGNLHIFHRSDRTWNPDTFDRNNKFRDISQGPIPNDTVVVVNTKNQHVLYTWGANRFYMPHGLNIDKHGNAYVTDVGLHQVMRFPAGSTEPDLVLGTALEPGNDRTHFCKPSDALTTDHYIFVSDGYCNTRVVLFSLDGQYLDEFGVSQHMHIPHSLTLVPKRSAICVTDREGDRILCYATGAHRAVGTLLADIHGQGLGRTFAADARGKDLFVVNGPDLFYRSPRSGLGLIIDVETGKRTGIWGPDKGFEQPHDLAVSVDGRNVYVCEIDLSSPKRVYKYNIRD